jgi:hypothetical protein
MVEKLDTNDLVGIAGEIDITLPASQTLPLFGFAGRTQAVSKITLPLFASIIVLRDKHNVTSVIITLDTLFAGNALTERLSWFLKQKFSVVRENFLLAASHTHFAPALDCEKPILGICNESYVEWVAERIEHCICELFKKPFQSLTMQYGSSLWSGAVYRRKRWLLPYYGGERKIIWGEPVIASNKSGPSQGDVRLWFLHNAETKRVEAAIWTCACHPVGSPDNTAISSDFCGHIRREISRCFEYPVPVLFLQGFAGDQRPDVPERRPLWRRAISSLLFGPTFDSFNTKTWEAWLSQLATAIRIAMECASKQEPVRLTGVLQGNIYCAPLSDIVETPQARDRQVTFQRLACGGLFNLFCVSAEVSIKLADMIPNSGDIPVGYAGDVFGYWPTSEQVREGGYEAKRFFKAFGLAGQFKQPLDLKFKQAAAAVSLPAGGTSTVSTAQDS